MPGGGRRVLFIHGYGGNLGQPGVKWFMNRFREHGLDMTYVQLPTEVGDASREEKIRPGRNGGADLRRSDGGAGDQASPDPASASACASTARAMSSSSTAQSPVAR